MDSKLLKVVEKELYPFKVTEEDDKLVIFNPKNGKIFKWLSSYHVTSEKTDLGYRFGIRKEMIKNIKTLLT